MTNLLNRLRRRWWLPVPCLLMVVGLAACGPDPDRVACEAQGGEYVAHLVTMVQVGKVWTPIYAYTCEVAQ